MNIFVTDNDPYVCAKNLDDKRVIKMILESAQMLSTAMHVLGIPGAPYKETHRNHPCSIWARQSRENYEWLIAHMNGLCNEYTRRYQKIHKCDDMLVLTFSPAANLIPSTGLTPFANCTPHKDMAVIPAYRLTMKEKWAADKRKPTWKNCFQPTW